MDELKIWLAPPEFYELSCRNVKVDFIYFVSMLLVESWRIWVIVWPWNYLLKGNGEVSFIALDCSEALKSSHETKDPKLW